MARRVRSPVTSSTRRVRSPGLQTSGNFVWRPGAPTRRGQSSAPLPLHPVVRLSHCPHRPPRNRNRDRNRDRKSRCRRRYRYRPRHTVPGHAAGQLQPHVAYATSRCKQQGEGIGFESAFAMARRICDAPLQKWALGSGYGALSCAHLVTSGDQETGNWNLRLATLPGTKARGCSLWFPAVVPEKAGVLTC